MKKRVKIAITGAAGNIGYAALFRIAAGEMLGPDTEIELQLLELEHSLPKLQGIAMELEDCAFPLLKKVICTADPKEAFNGANWALLIGSVPRKAGMERSDLLKINGSIFTAQGRAINENAADDVRVFVVGNPCNTNCLIAMHNAPDVPRDRFFAMTMLDGLRAIAQLAIKAKVYYSDIARMAVWGNHSSTQFPDFYHATIQGKPVIDVISDKNWLENEFITTVQNRGAAVIKALGSSSAASAANAAIKTVYDLTHDTPPNDFFSVACCSQGEYGIQKGLIFSFPCRYENNQFNIVTDLSINDFARNKILLTEKELIQEYDTVKSLGLI